MAAGHYDAALPYFQRDLTAAEAAAGRDSPALSATAQRSGRGQPAGRKPQEGRGALPARPGAGRDRPAEDPKGLATTLNNLALVYREEGRIEEAEKLHERSLGLLRTRRAERPPASPWASTISPRSTGRRAAPIEARTLEERAVAVAEKALGPRHPDTRKMQATLAALGTAPPLAAPHAPPGRSPVSGKGALPPPPPERGAGARRRHAATPRNGARRVRAAARAAVPARGSGRGRMARLVRKFPDLQGLELAADPGGRGEGKGTFYRVIAGPLATQAAADAPVRAPEASGSDLPPRAVVTAEAVLPLLRRPAAQFAAAIAEGSLRHDTPGFRIHLWPTPHPFYRNVAIPIAGEASSPGAIATMLERFAAEQRTARLEFVAELWPALGPALERAGLVVERPGGACAPPGRTGPAASGAAGEPARRHDAPPALAAFLAGAGSVFDEPTALTAPGEIERLARGLASGTILAAACLVADRPVAGASLIRAGPWPSLPASGASPAGGGAAWRAPPAATCSAASSPPAASCLALRRRSGQAGALPIASASPMRHAAQLCGRP